MALNRLVAMSDLSALLGAERTRRRHLISAAIDPQRTFFLPLRRPIILVLAFEFEGRCASV